MILCPGEAQKVQLRPLLSPLPGPSGLTWPAVPILPLVSAQAAQTWEGSGGKMGMRQVWAGSSQPCFWEGLRQRQMN